MKKVFTMILIAAILLAAIPTINVFAGIGDYYYNPDEGFAEFLEEVYDEYGYTYDEVNFSKENLYNSQNNVSGILYEFNFDNQIDGFMLMSKVTDSTNTDIYGITEIFFETKSPYYNCTGTKMYPTFLSYIQKIDNTYLDLTTGDEINSEVFLGLEKSGFGFSGEGSSWSATETINYSTKTDVTNKITKNIPSYTIGSNLGPNGCAVTSGTIIVGYWDSFQTNLIPSWTPGVMFFGAYNWKGQESPATAAADDLYVYMETNQSGDGTTIEGFRNGMIEYAQDHGNYSVTYRTVMSGGAYSLSLLSTEFSNNRPVALFLSPYYNLTSDMGIITGSGVDTILQTNYYGAHAMVSYGQRTISYYNSGNLFRTDRYLLVSSAINLCAKGFLRITDTYCNIYDAFSVEIS